MEYLDKCKARCHPNRKFIVFAKRLLGIFNIQLQFDQDSTSVAHGKRDYGGPFPIHIFDLIFSYIFLNSEKNLRPKKLFFSFCFPSSLVFITFAHELA